MKSYCRHAGCSSKVPAFSRYCDKHSPGKNSRPDKFYGTKAWKVLRSQTLARDIVCQAEDCRRPGHHVDHITPRSEGGKDTMDNLQALCAACHSKKTRLENRPAQE